MAVCFTYAVPMSPFQSAVEANIAGQIITISGEKRISQAELAQAAGVSRESMNAYLKGRTSMPLRAVIAVAERLGVPFHVLASRASGLDAE